MGINCKICLPLDVQANRVLKVISKVLNDNLLKDTFKDYSSKEQKKKPFDSELPSSNENSWYFSLDPKVFNITNRENLHTMCSMNFKSINDHYYNWYFHLEDESEEYKSLSPGVYAVSAVVGKKLVDFFGGKVLFNDFYDWDNDKYVYMNDNPKFPKKQPEQTSDDRWHQFENLLNIEPLVTSEELVLMSDIVGSSPEDVKLIKFLSTKEFNDRLANTLPRKDSNDKTAIYKI